MAREVLTAKGLESRLAAAREDAASRNTRIRISDGNGLQLIVRANGGASWVLEYSLGGRRRPLTIGPWPDVSLRGARDAAEQARAQVARGIDPLERKAEASATEKRAREAATRPADTVLAMLSDWVRIMSCSAVYRGNIEAAMLKDVLPAIGSREPHTVTRLDCLQILRKIEDRGSHDMVRRVRMWMRQLFDFGVDDERRPLLTANPVPMGELRSFARHDSGNFAAITRATEVPDLMRAIGGYSAPIVRTLLLLSAHTFQRPSEVRELVWGELDLDAAVWTIPAARMKLRREHLVPLSTQVVALLRMHAGVVGSDGWVFPGRRRGRPLSEGAAEVAMHALGYKGRHTPHGFRAMARTVGEEALRFEPKWLEKQLAHEYDPSGLRGAYNRAEFWDERAAMMQAWSDWLDAQAAEKK